MSCEEPAGAAATGGAPIDAVRGVLDAAGIARRRLRTVVGLLTDAPYTLAALVGEAAVERRAVEAVLAALGGDLETVGADRMRIAASRVDAYRRLIGYPRLIATAPADPLGQLLSRHAPLVARMRHLIAGAPRPRRQLDHVPATAETVVRRALWLDGTFDLDRARLLCVGDHDLTSLAVAGVNPGVEVMVVDVDDEILGYIDAQGLATVRCLWSDLRFGLAEGARERADLVFTDPPYTPEGVGLFLARGLEGLRDRENSRLVMAYGFGAGHPGLGLKVQGAVAGMRLVYEAVLPGFNRYHGAQAVGGSSDLYVLRPTSGSWRSGGRSGVTIYTHGSHSVEASTALAPEIAEALRASAAGPDGLAVTFTGQQPPPPAAGRAGRGPRTDGPPPPAAAPAGDATLPLDAVLAGDLPTDLALPGRAVALDLRGDPGSWLVRVLLAVDVPRLAALVPNNHPDLADEAGQRALADLVRVKYRLRLRRSAPGPRYAIVEADSVAVAELSTADRAVRRVLDRAHGKVANTWREALIRAGDHPLTRNEARTLIQAVEPAVPEERLVDLPRHRIAELLRGVAESARAHGSARGQT